MTEIVVASDPSPGVRATARGQIKQPSMGKGVRYYADVHRKARNGEGYRITYTSDGVTFKHTDSFAEIPVNAGDKLFVDVLPVHHTDGAIELIRRGVEVYYLRRLTLIARRREELKLSKTTRGDIKALMTLEERWFRKVTEDYLIMRRLFIMYRTLQKAHAQLLNKAKALPENERATLKPMILTSERQLEELATRIADEAGKRHPAYNRIVEVLGVHGAAGAMEALAEVLFLPEWRSWMKTRNFFGLWKRDKKTFFHKSRTARQALERLTITIKGFGIKSRDLEDVLKRVWLAQKAGPPA